MACVKNIPPGKADSEMEEGEIIDEVDGLSDISSEEEFLLRQRLEILEDYNSVLERKKTKKSLVTPGKQRCLPINDLSDVSATELEDTYLNPKFKENLIITCDQKHVRSHHKQRRRKNFESHNHTVRNKSYKKKLHLGKKNGSGVIGLSSGDSDDDYRNKRRKLENAVTVHTGQNEQSSLQIRLQKMFSNSNLTKRKEHPKPEKVLEKVQETKIFPKDNKLPTISSIKDIQKDVIQIENLQVKASVAKSDQINLCKDKDVTITIYKPIDKDDVDGTVTKDDSDDDLELLRQHALKTKTAKECVHKPAVPSESKKQRNLSEEEDSDTEELRIICLKSALLKRAIEIKQKQRLRKRLSHTLQSQDELMNEFEKACSDGNNTDIESVDMDIGSDAEEKAKYNSSENVNVFNESLKTRETSNKKVREDEVEEDEDLLRAKLLISLSKNLPNLVDPNFMDKFSESNLKNTSANESKLSTKLDDKKLIINLGESESEDDEHEATKNLTKMHMKLSERKDFQQQLDAFLKTTRMEVEKQIHPDVVQEQALPQSPQKYVAKAVNNLPKSEQIEYKNLVKRMAELEKIKQARQAVVPLSSTGPIKVTLKPRNTTTNSSISAENADEKIALSRKRIAEESARVLSLKEEANKLIQKYKIVASELKNISTAIALNKKEQRVAQRRLTTIRNYHQKLVISSNYIHSKDTNKLLPVKLQKENDPLKKENQLNNNLQTMKITIPNNLNETPIQKLSVQADVSNIRKIVKVPANQDANVKEDILSKVRKSKLRDSEAVPIGSDKSRINSDDSHNKNVKDANDYESPLQAFIAANWDPNAILCPFEVGGNCKDPDCKYSHPEPRDTPTQ